MWKTRTKRLPYRQVKYTLNVAVLNARLGRTDDAISAFESILSPLEQASDPNLLRAYFLLGELYFDGGQLAKAESSYRRYLERTAGLADPGVQRHRSLVEERLAALQAAT